MLSTTTEYALRALIELARQTPGVLLAGRDLAASTGIPANYLSKVLSTLRHAGLIQASRGLSGGYQLGRVPKEIRLVDVVELFEGVRCRPACILDRKKPCADETACPAHRRFRRVRETYVRFLEETSIAAITGNKRQ